jgi:ADP-heptose:LPS heptosyltransferase
MNGMRDFGKAFALVIKAIQDIQLQNSASNLANNLEYIIIFMSDGQAEFPDQQLDTLLTMVTKINQFWTVALGNTKMDILERINQKMNGTFKELKNSADLVQVYAEIARN